MKDAINITKIMILSFTFWKVNNERFRNEKQHLQSKIVWHPVWRDLGIWASSLFLSIREEIKNQKEMEDGELLTDTMEREKNIVFGQLLSFSHNMVAFMVEKVEIKKIIEKICAYFEIKNEKIQALLVIIKIEKKINFFIE